MADVQPQSLDEALSMLQADPPVLTKSKAGQVGNQKTKYADLVEVNKVVLAKLNQLGVVYVCKPTLRADDPKFVLDYRLIHVPSGEFIHGEYPLKLSDQPQQMGSAITYARRYALLAVTGIAAEDEDDDGGAASGQQYAQRRNQSAAAPAAAGRTAQRRPAGAQPPLPGEDADPAGPVEQRQMRRMHALWNELGFGGDENRDNRLGITAKILGLPDLSSSADLNHGQADQVIAKLVERKDAMATTQDAEQ